MMGPRAGGGEKEILPDGHHVKLLWALGDLRCGQVQGLVAFPARCDCEAGAWLETTVGSLQTKWIFVWALTCGCQIIGKFLEPGA